jgi:glycosyltransferase involved in cell wall biosynthesis
MSCEVPVVASAVGGTPDAVTDGVDGLLVPWGDQARLAAAIDFLIADPAARKRIAAAGRIRVQRDFSPALMADRYMSLYQDVR